MNWPGPRFVLNRLLWAAAASGTLLVAQARAQDRAPVAAHGQRAVPMRAPAWNRPPTANVGGPGGSPYPIRTDIAPPTGLIPPAAAYTGIAPNGLQTVGPRSRPAPFIFPFVTTPVFYPPAPDPGFSPAQLSAAPDAATAQLSASQDALAEQIRQLSANLEEMKNAQSQQAEAAAPPVQQQPQPEEPPVILVLRNGQQLTVKSYAVMNGTVWDFSGQRVRKVPLAQIDLAASAKATEAAGGDFPDSLR